MTPRNTKQKKIIMDALRYADHPTATELYGRVKAENPSISRGTVFRVLSQFAQSGEITKLCFADSPARFDARLAPHAHARCIFCGKVFDVFDEDLSPAFSKKQTNGFEIYAASVDYTGCCPNCNKSNKEKNL